LSPNKVYAIETVDPSDLSKSALQAIGGFPIPFRGGSTLAPPTIISITCGAPHHFLMVWEIEGKRQKARSKGGW